MKVRQSGLGSICYVAKLNHSDALPQALLNDNGTVSIILLRVCVLTCPFAFAVSEIAGQV